MTEPTGSTTNERYLTTKEVAALLSISLPTAKRYLKSGAIPSIKIGGAVRIPAGELDLRLRQLSRK